jgi:hypothetical protein
MGHLKYRSFTRPGSVITMAILAVGASTAIAATSAGPVPPSAYASGQRSEAVTAVDAADLAAFDLLKAPVTAADLPPASATTGLESGSFVGMFGANLNLARRATGFAAGAAWLVPANGALCLLADSTLNSAGAPVAETPGAAVCASDNRATAGEMELETAGPAAPGMDFAAGAVPDGTTSVVFTLADGTQVPVPVHDNVYMAETHGAISSITVSLPTGAKTISNVGLSG